jgi:hypothetical protein
MGQYRFGDIVVVRDNLGEMPGVYLGQLPGASFYCGVAHLQSIASVDALHIRLCPAEEVERASAELRRLLRVSGKVRAVLRRTWYATRDELAVGLLDELPQYAD